MGASEITRVCDRGKKLTLREWQVYTKIRSLSLAIIILVKAFKRVMREWPYWGWLVDMAIRAAAWRKGRGTPPAEASPLKHTKSRLPSKQKGRTSHARDARCLRIRAITLACVYKDWIPSQNKSGGYF
jgi:hypothetical protein